MAFIIKDMHPQNGSTDCSYFVGTRKMKDPMGRDCEAADFGSIGDAVSFGSRNEAEARAAILNKIANRKQFVVVENSIYNRSYGKRRSNGFSGFGTLPNSDEVYSEAEHGGYNGF